MSPFAFGSASENRLKTCDPRLQRIANQAIRVTPVDFTIVWGFRGEESQNELFRTGMSQRAWPDSTHNRTLEGLPWSLALDFAPWVNGRIYWNDTHMFAKIAGVFFAVAGGLEIPLRWGGDWNMDGRTTDQTLMDWGHIELLETS